MERENTSIPPAWKTARAGARPLLVYLALVGLPLAGLAVVLRAGAALEAPPVVAGAFGVSEGPRSCLGLSSDEPLRIEQSGRYLRVSAARASANTTLDADHLRVVLTPDEGPCRGQRVLLEARVASVDGASKHPELAFALKAQTCVPCNFASFPAQRISK